MNMTTFLTNYWNDMVNRDGVKLHEYFKPTATIYLHDVNEISDVSSMIGFNCRISGNLSIAIDKIEKLENGQFVTVTFHRTEDWVGFIISFFTLENDKIIELHEYYAECDEIPQWRTDLSEHEKIKYY